ncbi:hypothetical protein GGI11_003690 [Coemansia sp. RSA 2049]|nr:hypothetical protein GGI11_003690 [Coemansia sp. RSA 2049]
MVISTAMDKTVRVRVPKRVMNRHVQKEILVHKNYMAHDEFEKCNLGDVVRIEHCRKLSRHKSFAVAEIIKAARTWTDPDTGIDLYLKEIRSYKPDPKAAKAEVTTKNFVAPKVPETPKNDIKLESDIKAYERSGVVSVA